MSYSVKEIYYTLQGEGFHTGRPAVFIRFSGCNLWSGREEDRSSAFCRFCDTDFRGTGSTGGLFSTPDEIVNTVSNLWPDTSNTHPFVVCTGGEPLLQLDQKLVDSLKIAGFEIAIETNGTLGAPEGIDWICVSPKSGTDLVVKKGGELKLVFPQAGIEPHSFLSLEFEHFYLQPMDGPDLQENTRSTLQYCLDHPQWTLSLQTHKILNIP